MTAKDSFVEFQAGATVFKAGDAGAEMYIIESGHVDLLAAGGEVTASFGPGDFFGEAAVLDDAPRAATAQAKERTRMLRIERAAFADVLRQNADIALRMMRTMAARHNSVEQRLGEVRAELQKARAAAAAPRPEAPAVREPVVAAAPPPPPPKPQPAAQLVLRVGDQALPIDAARTELLVGRPDPATGSTPEINLGPFDANRTLSRRHAKILRDGAVYFLREEAGVGNGTFVNGERVQPGVNVPIKPGDKLRFGLIEAELGVA